MTDERFDAAISTWFEDAGPARLPKRALDATFERTRRSRQHVGWREVLERRDTTRFIPALGGAAVVVVAAALALNFYLNQPSVGGPDVDPRRPFEGTWLNRTDADGGTQTMTVRAAEADGVAIVVLDDIATVCSGTASTMTGTGHIEGSTRLVIASPVYTCDDGSEPRALSGPPLAEQLRNLTFVYHPESDTLTLGNDVEAVWLREAAPDSSPAPSVSPPSEAEVNELLNGFLEARVAGAGAQQYLNAPEHDVPLLYATTSGAPYERAEFERVPGIEWPYGWTAFKVRLFAGDTVVEQLVFLGRPDGSPLRLEYQWDGFGTPIAPTVENRQPVAMSYTYFDGAVSLRAAHPWIGFGNHAFPKLIPEGPGVPPTTDGGQRHDGWDQLLLIPDPVLVGTGCQAGPSSADVAALAEGIRSYPGAEATEPIAVSIGGADGLMLDVVIAAGTTITVPAADTGDPCTNGLLDQLLDQSVGSSITYANGVLSGQATGDKLRLYLINVPSGASMRTLAVTILAPAPRFERAVNTATPIANSIQFHVSVSSPSS